MKSAGNNIKTAGGVLLLFVLFISCQTGQPVKRLSDESIMYGMIYDYESSPVSSVAVFINGRKIADSDIQGRFILNDVKKGTYTIKLTKKGYEEREEQFTYEPLNVLYFKMLNAGQLASLAENSMDEYNYAAAESLIDRALKIEPERPDIVFLKSINYYLQKKYDESRALLENLIKSGATDESVTKLWEIVKEEPIAY
jgi:tetratricopeptide (TPR) repeat protein